MKKMNFNLTRPQYEQIMKIAQRTGLTIAELLRRAIDEYLERKESR